MIQRANYIRTLGALFVFGSISAPMLASDASPALSFARPAAQWTEAIPLGNGRIGAMDFGGVEEDRFQINESTLWGGGPHDYVKRGAADHLDEVRSLIFQGKITEAEKVSDTMMGAPKLLMPYQPFCNLRLHFSKGEAPSAYHRGLDLTSAVASTDYIIGGVSFHRESFVSFPDQVLVVHVTASKPGQLTVTVGMDSPQPGTQVSSAADGTMQLTGQIQPRQNSPRSWTGSWDEPGLRFAAGLKVLTEGGSVQSVGDHLEIANANAITLVFTNATSFRNYHDISGDPVSAVRRTLDQALKKSYTELREGHIADFRALFSRVQLQLGPASSNASDQTTMSAFATLPKRMTQVCWHSTSNLAAICSFRRHGRAGKRQICRASGTIRCCRRGAANGQRTSISR